jgi:hypothetical protein
MYLQKVISKQKRRRKNNSLLASWKSLKKERGAGSGSVIQVYDPKIQIQICAKMSWFQNTAFMTHVSAGERSSMGLHM